MIVSNYLTIDNDELSKREWRRLFNALTYMDGEGNEIRTWRELTDRGAVRLPRGAWNLLPDGIRYSDRRSFPEEPALKFKRKLDDVGFERQEEAVEMMFKQEQGLIVAQPGFGKTQVALAFAAKAETKTLVLVWTKDLFEQWVKYAKVAIPDADIGEIRGGKIRIGHITIAMVQTFYKAVIENPSVWKRMFGAVIVDEAHHSAAAQWEVILNALAAKYRIGFTASPGRADGRGMTVQFLVGPVIFKQKFKSKIPLQVELVNTGFKFKWRGAHDWSRLTRAIEHDPKRNALIAQKVTQHVQEGHTTLVLSRRIEHLINIGQQLGCDYEFLVGEMPQKERLETLEEMREGKVKCVLATQLADEGLDVPIISRVHLTFPGKHDGRILQQIGRSLREHDEKEDAEAVDYCDYRIKPLGRQAAERRAFYKRTGIPIKSKRKILPRRKKLPRRK